MKLVISNSNDTVTVEFQGLLPVLDAIARIFGRSTPATCEGAAEATPDPEAEKPKRGRKPKTETPVSDEPVAETPAETVAETPAETPAADSGELSYEAFKNGLITAATKLGNKKTMEIVTELTGCKSVGKVPQTKYQTVLDALNSAVELIA